MIHIETSGHWLENKRMQHYTSWRVGGNAKCLYKPAGAQDLINTLKQIPAELPIIWLGLGSNTLIRDGGMSGVTVLTQGALNELKLLANNEVYAGAGVSCATMARFCARNHLAEAEFWAGIPGTMGGALRMNAGCYTGETWQYVRTVETINRYGELKIRDKEEFVISYRHVDGLAVDEWFLGATFKLPKGDKASSLKNIKQLLARRAETQPTGEYNCGSVFRNPPGDYAARLIEACGLKGTKIGGAFVSTKHANFITNDGSACASDIEALIAHVATVVHASTGIQLQREVHIMGQKEPIDEL